MNRLDSIKSYLAPYKTKRMREKIAQIKGYTEETLLSHVQILLQEAEKNQHHQSWKPTCLCLFNLLSSVSTGSHIYQILLADDQVYLDRLQIINNWKADFFHEPEGECLKKVLQKQYARLSDYEVTYAEHWLQYEYHKLVELYWKEQIEKITNLKEFQQLKKGQPFCFLFGDYMGSVKIISANVEEEL